MSEERRRVLELLSSKKISTEEADRLMTAIEETPALPRTDQTLVIPRKRARYLRIMVDTPTEKVDLRIPLFLLRAGMKLAGLLPRSARESVTSAFQDKGIDIDISRRADLESLIDGLADLNISAESNVPGKTERVRIFCE
jgi:hypothetical protein